MKVVIAVASSSGQLSGVQRHAINLARCLLMRTEISEVHLIAAPWQQEMVADALEGDPAKLDVRLHIHSAKIGNNSFSRNRWFYQDLPKLAKRINADVVHLAYPVPVRRGADSCPTIVTLHDLYPYDIPENFGFPKVLFNRAVLQQCMQAVAAIACVSHSTLSRLQAMNPELAVKKARAIYNSVEPWPEADVPSALPQWTGQPFLLCVAQHRRNKNVLLLLKVFERLLRSRSLPGETNMVIVGIPGPETFAIHRFLRKSGLGDRVLLVNGISEEHLQWCYRNCLMLVAPSLIEGFGLPVAEALLTGCRVVCSDIPAFREFASESCRYVSLEADAEESFADAITAMMHTSSPLPVAMPQLSARIIAEEYLRLYQSLSPSPVLQAPATSHSFAVTEERQPLA